MLRFTLLALFASAITASAVPSLTPENYDSLTAGKTVFLKFFAPWVSTGTWCDGPIVCGKSARYPVEL